MPDLKLPFSFGSRLNRSAFEHQIQKQLPLLYRIARGVAGQASDAEDLVHDTCVKALTSFDKARFYTEGELRAWLNRILINTYRDQYRRVKRSPVRTDYHAGFNEDQNVVELVASTDPSPSESIQHRDVSIAIDNALSALPPEVRVVSVLFIFNGLSYKDIASITDCPIGTVMSRLARGRALLREKLSAYDPRDSLPRTADNNGGGKP